MPIPSHQIRNVLSSYAKLLARKNGDPGERKPACRRSSRKVLSDAEGKRRMVIDKVVSEIINKITAHETPGQKRRSTRPELEKERGRKHAESRPDDLAFTYYRMEKDGEKRKARYLPEK